MTPEEFKNIAPKLFELKKLKSGFDTPKDYLDSIEENIYSSIFLDSIGNKNSFEIPENYFDLVEPSVLEKIKNEDQSIPESYFSTVEDRVFEKIRKKPLIISLHERVIKKLVPVAIAASILLIFTFQFLTDNENNDFASINGDDIEFWIINGDLNLNDTELAFLYEDTEMESVSIFDFYEEEEVYDYLNELDVESLILTN
jgi:hypothetical protein